MAFMGGDSRQRIADLIPRATYPRVARQLRLEASIEEHYGLNRLAVSRSVAGSTRCSPHAAAPIQGVRTQSLNSLLFSVVPSSVCSVLTFKSSRLD